MTRSRRRALVHPRPDTLPSVGGLSFANAAAATSKTPLRPGGVRKRSYQSLPQPRRGPLARTTSRFKGTGHGHTPGLCGGGTRRTIAVDDVRTASHVQGDHSCSALEGRRRRIAQAARRATGAGTDHQPTAGTGFFRQGGSSHRAGRVVTRAGRVVTRAGRVVPSRARRRIGQAGSLHRARRARHVTKRGLVISMRERRGPGGRALRRETGAGHCEAAPVRPRVPRMPAARSGDA
jgi:hypothetical protein